MKLIKGYQQWLNENFQPIFEWAQPKIEGLIVRTSQATTATDGLDLNDYNAFIANTNVSETFSKFVAEFKKAGGIDAQTVLAALLAGSVKKKVFFNLFTVSDTNLVQKALKLVNSGQVTIDYDEGSQVNYQFDANGNVRTRGKILNGYALNRDPAKTTNAVSNLTQLVTFINSYNTNAYALNLPQYMLSDRIKEGFIDLLTQAGQSDSGYEYGGGKNKAGSTGSLYLYSTKKQLAQSAEGTESEETTEVGGTQAATSQYDTDFATGKADCTTPKVAAAVKAAAYEIFQLWPAGKGPTTFKLTSGASADYNGKLPTSTGTGQTFPGATPNEKANQKLAYDRGFNFMTAVNAELVRMGHPGYQTFEVNWVIGDTGGPAKTGKYVDLMLASQAIAPTVTVVKKYDSKLVGANSTGFTSGILYQFELSAYGNTKTSTPAPTNG